MWDAGVENASHNMNEVHSEGKIETLLCSLNLQTSNKASKHACAIAGAVAVSVIKGHNTHNDCN